MLTHEQYFPLIICTTGLTSTNDVRLLLQCIYCAWWLLTP